MTMCKVVHGRDIPVFAPMKNNDQAGLSNIKDSRQDQGNI